MDWITQNIFELVGIAGGVGTTVLATTRIYWSLENRIVLLEKDVKKLETKIEKDINEVNEILKELRLDIKKLLQRE